MKKITLVPILRAQAWAAMKATWKTLLPLVVLIQLASYVLNQIVGAIPVLGAFLTFLVTAAMSVPMLGLISGVMGYYRGKPLTQDCVKTMFPHWQKVCLLYLWTMLRLVGWIVLGMLPMLIGVVMLRLESAAGLGALLTLVGLVLMVVLAFRAALNYSMANCILVDAPSTGASEVLRKSKEMIHGYRWYSVKLEWPVFAVILIAGFVVSGLTAALPAWLASLISAGLACFTSMFSYYFLPVMYVELRRIGR